MLLKHYLDQRLTKAELARRFGVDRRTIHNWIASGQLERDEAAGEVRYKPRPPVARKLDPYKGIIESRLEEHPKLSAQRLFDGIVKAGYDGGYGQVRDHVRSVRPRPPAEEPVRFETPPGRQGQVDFGSFRFPWSRRHALVVVLGYSRLLWVRFYAGQTMTVLTKGSSGRSRPSAGAGGAAVRTGAGGGDVRRPPGRGRHRAERAVPALRGALGFKPRSCRPYRAQTKGKVERPICYIAIEDLGSWRRGPRRLPSPCRTSAAWSRTSNVTKGWKKPRSSWCRKGLVHLLFMLDRRMFRASRRTNSRASTGLPCRST